MYGTLAVMGCALESRCYCISIWYVCQYLIIHQSKRNDLITAKTDWIWASICCGRKAGWRWGKGGDNDSPLRWHKVSAPQIIEQEIISTKLIWVCFDVALISYDGLCHCPANHRECPSKLKLQQKAALRTYYPFRGLIFSIMNTQVVSLFFVMIVSTITSPQIQDST